MNVSVQRDRYPVPAELLTRAPVGTITPHVPMTLHLEHRRDTMEALAEIEGEVTAIRRELDRRSGREAAEMAAAAARRDRRKVMRDVGLCALSAVLATAGTLVTAAVL